MNGKSDLVDIEAEIRRNNDDHWCETCMGTLVCPPGCEKCHCGLILSTREECDCVNIPCPNLANQPVKDE